MPPQTQYIDKLVDMDDAANGPSNSDWVEDSGNPDQPGDQACRVPTYSEIRTVLKTVEIPLAKFVGRVVEAPGP